VSEVSFRASPIRAFRIFWQLEKYGQEDLSAFRGVDFREALQNLPSMCQWTTLRKLCQDLLLSLNRLSGMGNRFRQIERLGVGLRLAGKFFAYPVPTRGEPLSAASASGGDPRF
jgi:hypothetical protein